MIYIKFISIFAPRIIYIFSSVELGGNLMDWVVKELEGDHLRFRQYMTWLGEQIDLLEMGKHPDYELLNMLAEYFAAYPDELHHKKEDIIYAALSSKLRNSAPPLDDLHAEHEALSIRANHFSETIKAIVNDEEHLVSEVIQEAREYKALLGSHMKREEASLFKPVREHLTHADWNGICNEIDELYKDPIYRNKAQILHDQERSIDAYNNSKSPSE